jgi:hypothetical protein
MRLPISSIAVAVLATMVAATHMRVQEIALRSGLFKAFSGLVDEIFGGAKAVDIPTAKIDTPPAAGIIGAPPAAAAKIDVPSVVQGQSNLLTIKKIDLKHLYSTQPDLLRKEFTKLSKADQDIFNTRAIKYGHPPLAVPPKNYPDASLIDLEYGPFLYLSKLSDKEMKRMYRESPAFFLDEFKKMSSTEQAAFNAKIKKLKLGNPLIPIPPGVTKPIYSMNTNELRTLYKENKAFFEQETQYLPNSVKTKVNSQRGRPPDELPISDVARDPNMNSVVPANGKQSVTSTESISDDDLDLRLGHRDAIFSREDYLDDSDGAWENLLSADELKFIDEQQPITIPTSVAGMSDSVDMKRLHAPENREILEKEFLKLSKADQDAFNLKCIKEGYPQVVPAPKVIPADKSIVDYSDLQMVYIYRDYRDYFLQQFKKLSSADQAKFNAKLQKLNLGNPLLASSPYAKENILNMNSADLRILYKNDRAYFDQEVNALPDALAKKFTTIAQPFDETKFNSIPENGFPEPKKRDVNFRRDVNERPQISRLPRLTGRTSMNNMEKIALQDVDEFHKQFGKLSKADQDAVSVRFMRHGYEPPMLPPKNYPEGVSIVELTDTHLRTMYRDNYAWFLDTFKTLNPADQAKFNERIQKLSLGNPLIPNDPSVQKQFFRLQPPELKNLFQSNRAYFDQEASALPEVLKNRVYASVQR